jgi:hypothetical protein
MALAWPTGKTAPFADLSLASWSEARLIVQWRGISLQTGCVALFAVGADGPNPAAALRGAGWWVCGLPGTFGVKMANSAFPPRLPFLRPWLHMPTLLWPQSAAVEQPDGTETLYAPPDDGGAHRRYANVLAE